VLEQVQQLVIDNSRRDQRRRESREQLLPGLVVHHDLTALARTRVHIDLRNYRATVPVGKKRLPSGVANRMRGISGSLHHCLRFRRRQRCASGDRGPFEPGRQVGGEVT
jgi:hypothetical protein